ncbi:MAG: flippase [Candidatus Woesearchaeota archaeon]
MNYTRYFVRGTWLVFIILIASAFVGYLFRILLARNLSPSEYGLFFAVFSFLSFFMGFKALGLNVSVSRYVAEFRTKGDFKSAKNSLVYLFLVQALILSLFTTVAIILSNWLGKNYFKNEAAAGIIIVLAISFLLSTFETFFAALFVSFKKPVLSALIDLFGNAAIFVTTYLFFRLGLKTMAPAYANLISFALVPVVFMIFLLKTFPKFFVIPASFDWHLFKKLLYFGLTVIVGLMGSAILGYADTIILTYFRPLSDVGYYNVAIPIANLIGYIGKAVSPVILPMASELYALADKRLRESITKLQKWTFIILSPLALSLFAFPEVIINLFFGEKYLPAAIPVRLLSVGTIFGSIALINGRLLLAINKPKIQTAISLSIAALSVLLNLLLIPLLGIVGASITALTTGLINAALSTTILNRFVENKIPLFDYAKVIVASAAFVGTLFVLKKLLIINVLIEIPITIVVASLIYLLFLITLKTTSLKEIKNIIKSAI